MLAGLSGLYIFRTPPCFCADAGSATNRATSNDIATAKAPRSRFIPSTPLRCSAARLPGSRAESGPLIEPDVFHAPAVEDAVDHDGQSLDVGLPAGSLAGIKYDGAGAVIGQLAFDRPQQLLAPSFVGLDRLLLDQLVHLRVAIAVPVQARTASGKQIENLVGVGPAALEIEADGEV